MTFDRSAGANTSPSERRRHFDVRVLLAALLGVYGVVLTAMGATASRQAIAKAAGININLWVGVALLVLAALFLLWARLRPIVAEYEASDDRPDQGTKT